MIRTRLFVALSISTGLCIIVAIAAIGFHLNRSDGSKALIPAGPIQLDSCNGTPPFTTKLGLKNPRFTTATRDSQGLVIVYDDENGEQAVYTDPSYSSFGDLGAIAITAIGEVFVTGRPNIDVESNPADERNTIFRVDPQSGKLEPWTDLPLEHNATGQPFGLMGLAVDCVKTILYVTSLTGTSEETENGTVWQLDRQTKEATLLYKNLDATSVAVGTGLGQRYLLLGAARRPAILSVLLSKPDDQPQVLTGITGTGRWLSVRAIKLRPADGQIAVTAVDFDFSLRALPDEETETITIEWTPDGYRQVS